MGSKPETTVDEGPEYDGFLKVVLGDEPTATSYAFEADKFPDLIDELRAFLEKCRKRGVEYVEGRPSSGAI